MPGVLNVTGAGSAAVLPLGVPPGKLQEKVRGRFPSGSLPVPAKSTLWPARRAGAVLSVTGAGPAAVLPLGVPPGKLQEKVRGRFPSGSLPVPAKSTLWPARMVWSVAGAVIVPFGGWFGGAVTVMIRLAGVGSARPRASVTVNVTV